MVHLSEKERIEILVMIVYDDCIIHEEVIFLMICKPKGILFNVQGLRKHCSVLITTGMVKNLPGSNRPRTAPYEVITQNITIVLEESPQTFKINVALKHGISRRCMRKILQIEK